MRAALPFLLLVACRLHDSALVGVAASGRADGSVAEDGAPAADAAPDDAGQACVIPAPIAAWIFDVAADPSATVPDRAAADPDVPLVADERDPVGVSFGDAGVELAGGRLQAEPADGQALGAAVVAADALAVEVWAATPRDDNQGPARIVTYSSGAYTRAFSVLQEGDALETRLRTTATNENGRELEFRVPGIFPAAQARQIVLVYDGDTGSARLYVDGVLLAEREHRNESGEPADLNWDVARERLGCGDEFDPEDGLDRIWRGTLRSVRIWSVTLDDAQVACRMAEGP